MTVTKFMNTQTSMEPWIETVSGQQFWYTGITTEGIDIEDIAHALSNLCRFTGQCKYFYSVAEHSVYVSRLVHPEVALHGLLHDASEAYLTDIASPAKQLLPDYKELEEIIMERIADKFYLPVRFDKSDEVKQADWSQLQTEARFLLPSKGANWFFPEGLKVGHVPIGYSPESAKRVFLDRYKELTK